MEYLQSFGNSALTFGGNLARWGYAHPGEAMGWVVGLFAVLKALTWGSGKFFNRHKDRVAKFLKEVMDVKRDSALNIAVTIPTDDPRLVLGKTAMLVSSEAGYDEPYGILASLGDFFTKITPGGRGRQGRQARRRLDKNIVAVLERWKQASPTALKAEYARALAEAVTGRDIGDYIMTGFTPGQTIEASLRRYLAVSARRRAKPNRTAALMAIAAAAYKDLAEEARDSMANLHKALKVVGDPDNLAAMVRLIKSEPQVALALKNSSGTAGGLQLSSHPASPAGYGSRASG